MMWKTCLLPAILFAVAPASAANDTGDVQRAESEPLPVVERAAGLRDPFLPVGMEKAADKPVADEDEAKKAPPTPVQWDQAMALLKVKGIMQVGQGERVATVNDRILRRGDELSLVFKGRRYRWRVHAVNETGIRFRPLTAEPLPDR